jgi:hypothetical protein
MEAVKHTYIASPYTKDNIVAKQSAELITLKDKNTFLKINLENNMTKLNNAGRAIANMQRILQIQLQINPEAFTAIKEIAPLLAIKKQLTVSLSPHPQIFLMIDRSQNYKRVGPSDLIANNKITNTNNTHDLFLTNNTLSFRLNIATHNVRSFVQLQK